jgi:hypothetical protein
MQLRKEVPLELVVNMFRKLVSSFSRADLAADCVGLPTFFFFVEPATHHVFAGRRTKGHDHKDGHRSSIDGTLYPSWCSRRRNRQN